MNAAIRSVVRTCAYLEVECTAIYRGYQGMIEGDFVPFNARSVNNIINKGGTILKTARCNDFRTPEGRKKAHEQLVKAGIQGFIVIGGDGSFRGASIFHEEFDFPVILPRRSAPAPRPHPRSRTPSSPSCEAPGRERTTMSDDSAVSRADVGEKDLVGELCMQLGRTNQSTPQ